MTAENPGVWTYKTGEIKPGFSKLKSHEHMMIPWSHKHQVILKCVLTHTQHFYELARISSSLAFFSLIVNYTAFTFKFKDLLYSHYYK